MKVKLVRAMKVTPLDGYRLELTFSDGSSGVADLSDLIREDGPMVDPLKDPAFFDQVFLDFGAPTWPNEFDLDPSNLRWTLEKAGKLRKAPAAA